MSDRPPHRIASLGAALLASTPRRWGAAACAAVGTWAVAHRELPRGAPLGEVLAGLAQGAPVALVAMSIVLIWRANRVINFAAAAMGGVGGSIAMRLFEDSGVPFAVALLLAPVLGAAIGAAVEVGVIRRFASSGRLILGVATIGLVQLLGGVDLLVGSAVFGDAAPIRTGATTPLSDFSFSLTDRRFTGNHVLPLVVVPLVAALATVFLRRTIVGTAIRAAAENEEQAKLLGLPVRRLHLIVWAVAGAVGALAFALEYPISGSINSAVTGPAILLPALAAAVVARLESLPVAFAGALVLGIIDAVTRWNISTTPGLVNVVYLVAIAGALLAAPAASGRADDGAEGWGASSPLRPLPSRVRRVPEVRMLMACSWGAVIAAAIAAPLALEPTLLASLTASIVLGIAGLSLVVLSGWAGQVSLGQLAFVGTGALVCGRLIERFNLDLLLAIGAAVLVSGAVAFLVGLPALRVRGPHLAVITLAFAEVFDSVVLNDNTPVMEPLVPSRVNAPLLLQRWDVASPTVLYWLAVVILAICVLALRGVRQARSGRLVNATRDNPRAVQAVGGNRRRQVLAAFTLAGMMCGAAGSVYVLMVGGLGPGAFPAGDSVTLFSQSVIGGLGSALGALSGVFGLRAVHTSIHDPMWRLLTEGVGLLVVLMVMPGGLATAMGAVRDRVVAAVLRRRRLDADGEPLERDGFHDAPATAAAAPAELDAHATSPSEIVRGTGVDAERVGVEPAVSCRNIDVSFGRLQVLFGVDLTIAPGEIVALLGTNGAGKSTVLRAICGLVAARGECRVGGRRITGMSPQGRVGAGVAMVAGGRATFPSLTVDEHLRLAGWRRRREPDEMASRRVTVLDRFPGLLDHLDRTAGALSGGQQQQLALAQAMLLEPEVLLIDELSLGLAPVVVGSLMDVVADLNAGGTTVVVVEQSINIAVELAERAIFMEKGEVRFDGPTAELARRPDLLRAVFLDGHDPGAGPGPRVSVAPIVDLTTRRAAVLQCEGIDVSFGGVRALESVSLSVAPGEIVGLIGQNGAGKTTLLDCISGFCPTDRGRIVLAGADIARWSPDDRARHGLGRTFQSARLFPSLTVLETLALACERHLSGTSMLADATRQPASFESELSVSQRALELAFMLGLAAHRDRLTSELSTGMRRLVELGCQLAVSPSVLLLDEPSAGVAQREAERLGPLLAQIRDTTGAALVIIEHDMPLLRGVCDRMVALDQGRVLIDATPDEVLADPAVVAAYLGTSVAAIERSH